MVQATTYAHKKLCFEFTLFYLVFPLVMAICFPASWMFPMLFGLTAIGFILLILTPDFKWIELFHNIMRINWRFVGLCSVATTIVCYGVIMTTYPDAAFVLIRERPHVMLMIAILYPVISALPQELVFRALFFNRYQSILPTGRKVLLLNAVIFSYAHLMYWSLVVLILTFIAGLIFAYSHEIAKTVGVYPLSIGY